MVDITGREQARWREAHLPELLPDLDALLDLPHGTLVEMVWSGGNGPHCYRIHEIDGTVYAAHHEHFTPNDWRWTYNPIYSVGTERFNTMVRVLSTPDNEEPT